MATRLCIGPDGGLWSESGPVDSPVGLLVKFKVPSLHGQATVAGTVKRDIGRGHIEVKTTWGQI